MITEAVSLCICKQVRLHRAVCLAAHSPGVRGQRSLYLGGSPFLRPAEVSPPNPCAEQRPDHAVYHKRVAPSSKCAERCQCILTVDVARRSDRVSVGRLLLLCLCHEAGKHHTRVLLWNRCLKTLFPLLCLASSQLISQRLPTKNMRFLTLPCRLLQSETLTTAGVPSTTTGLQPACCESETLAGTRGYS